MSTSAHREPKGLQTERERRWLVSPILLDPSGSALDPKLDFVDSRTFIVQTQVLMATLVARRLLSRCRLFHTSGQLSDEAMGRIEEATKEAMSLARENQPAKVRFRRERREKTVVPNGRPTSVASLAIKAGRGTAQRECEIFFRGDVDLQLDALPRASSLRKTRYGIDVVRALRGAGIHREMQPAFTMVIDHFTLSRDARVPVPVLRGDESVNGGRPTLVVQRGSALVAEAEETLAVSDPSGGMDALLGPEGSERFALPWLTVETTPYPGLVRRLAEGSAPRSLAHH